MPYHEAFPCSVYTPVTGFGAGMSCFAPVPGVLVAGVFLAGSLARSVVAGVFVISLGSAVLPRDGSGRSALIRRDAQPQKKQTQNAHKTQTTHLGRALSS